MEVRAKGTAYKIWADSELEKHFEKRSRMVLIDLRRRLQELRCPNKGSIIDHFANLRTMQEDLASMGELLTRAAHRNRTIRVVRYSCTGTRNVPLGFESQKLTAVRTTAVNRNEP